MEISKSTPYVRYRENISSSLHKGTVHIESEYLDRERKTTIESIEGQTWQNMVNGENKEEDILPRLGLKIQGKEDMLDSKEQHMPIDTIIGDIEPVANEDGTYTYEISTMEGSYAKTLEGENNFLLTSDGLNASMYIKYNAQGEEVNGNIVMNNQSDYTIENSSNGEINGAILKGQTLVNLLKVNKDNYIINNSQNWYVEDGYLKCISTTGWHTVTDKISSLIKSNTKYLIFVEIKENTLNIDINFDGYGTALNSSTTYLSFNSNEVGIKKVVITTPSTIDSTKNGLFRMPIDVPNEGSILKFRVMAIEYQDGMENWDIPYFEGMQSVTMPVVTTTGKNLLNDNTSVSGWITEDGTTTTRGALGSASDYLSDFIYVGNINQIKINRGCYVTTFDESKKIISQFANVVNANVANCSYIRIAVSCNGQTALGLVGKMQVEEGTVATPYEPHKSNILTTPSDLKLRKVGNVQDELNLETGELTQRIGEITFNGSDDENWWYAGESDTIVRCNIKINIKWQTQLLSANIPVGNRNLGTVPYQFEGIANHFEDYIYLYVKKEKIENFSDDLQDHEKTYRVKDWLLKNPITIQYQLATPIISQFDLTIKDQDDKIIQTLHTHPSTTYINLSSDGLIPNAEMNYTMYGNIGETTGEKITDGTDSKLIEGKIYGDTLCNVLPSPSLKNSMDYNISMQKLNNGYDNINVADGEFKQLTLQGQTLVNLANTIGYKTDLPKWRQIWLENTLTPNTKYFIKIYGKPTNAQVLLTQTLDLDNDGSYLTQYTTSDTYIFTTPTTMDTYLKLHINDGGVSEIITVEQLENVGVLILEYQEDMENQDIPYFEGIQSVVMPSVKTTGKNVFSEDNSMELGAWESNGNSFETSSEIRCKNNYTPFPNGLNNGDVVRIVLSDTSINSNTNMHVYDENKTRIITLGYGTSPHIEGTDFINGVSTVTIHDASKCKYFSFRAISTNTECKFAIMVNTSASYEPYQSNTLTLNESIELRAIGDVKDELDLLKGELIKRIGFLQINHNTPCSIHQRVSENIVFKLRIDGLTHNANYTNTLCDKFKVVAQPWNGSEIGCGLLGEYVYINIPQTIANTVEDFKTYLLNLGEINLIYALQTEVVKTVDLSIVNQDNQPQTTLHSISNGYLNVSSQGLLPKVDYEAPTSNSYYLDTMVKPNTQYTTKSSSDCNAIIDGTTYPLSANGTFTTPSTITDKMMILDTPVDDLMFIEGDVTGRELDYFTGLQSVESVDVSVYPSDLDNINFMGMIEWENDYSYLYRLPVKGQRLWYKTGNMWNYIKFYDKNKQFLGQETNSGMGGSYQISSNLLNKDIISKAVYFSINKKSPSGNVQIMQLRTKNNLPDIPYTDNIINLTTNEPIALHKIGDVKDELDLVNECVIRRIGKFILDGSFASSWRVVNTSGNTILERSASSQEPNLLTLINNYGFPKILDKNNSMTSIPIDTSLSNTNSASKKCPSLWMDTYFGNYFIRISIPNGVVNDIDRYGYSYKDANRWLNKNPITILYKLETPTTDSVRLVPQNAKQSTTLLTLQSPLQKVGNIADQLRWNPYKGHYVRYNYIQDGVANSTYTFEDLKDMNERKFVNLYNQRTYIDTDHTVQVNSHGLSRYCLAEQGKQYQVRWDWIEQSSVDTIKVDLCGNVKEIPSGDNSVVIDVEKFTHQFIQIQGLGLTGKLTNLMVIETIDGEIPDVDFFSGVKAIGNTVQIDGATKVQIDMEQTNGNLFDIEPVIFNNGNYISYCWNENNRGMPIKNGKTYTFKHLKRQDGEWGDYGLRTFDENLKLIRTISLISGTKIREHSFTAQYNEKYIRGYGQMTLNGSTHTHYPVELCYTDMVKDGIRPRHHDMKSFILPMKLCRVGEVYDELYYDDLKGYYRIQQSIGHKYFTGDASERWEMGVINLNSRTVAFTYKNGDINQLAMGDTICNGFKRLKDVNQDTEGFIIYNGDFVLRIDKERIEGNCSIDGLRAYLTSYPIHLFYQLKTPQMVDLPQYPNRLELNTYRDEVFTFIKDSNPTKFTLSIPMDRTYRSDDHQEGQGLANRVSITDERISSENVVAIQEIRGKGIANLIEDPNNVPVTPLPNYSGVATSHQLTNTKPSIVHVHGFEPNGDTKIGTWNTTDKKYQIKVMSGNSNYSLSDYYVLDVPYQLETYPDGTKDRVYYNVERQEWQVNGSYDRTIAFNASTGAFTDVAEIFRGMTPRSGMIAEFKLRFTSGTTTARLYYSVNGSTYSYVTLRGMVDDQDYYLAFFNTGGTKIDYSTKVGATTEYASMTALSATIPEGLFVNQIQSLTECTHYVDKFYQYPTLHTPIELDTYDGTTNIYIDGKTTDTNIIINNDCFQKVVNTYEDVEYTVYWKYLSGDGKLTITLGGTRVEVDGTKEYATIRTQLQASQELVYIGGYNLSIQDVMVVKGARIDGLAYFEGSRQVGTLVVDEHGNKQYKITLVQGGSVLEQKDYDKVEFKDDNKHNVVVHKIVGVRPTKVD